MEAADSDHELVARQGDAFKVPTQHVRSTHKEHTETARNHMCFSEIKPETILSELRSNVEHNLYAKHNVIRNLKGKKS